MAPGRLRRVIVAWLDPGNNEPMLLTPREIPVLIVTLLYVPFFTIIALRNLDFEFLLYIGVVAVAVVLVLLKQHAVRFDGLILWGLTGWGFLHLAGGNLHVGDGVLYNLTLVPIVGAPYHILRYDQVVHLFGFGVATLVCHHLLKPYLRPDVVGRRTLFVLVVLMGAGVGALNEVLEFAAVVSVPETNVGGYENTALDLLFNLLGASVAAIYLGRRRPATA